MIPCVCRPLYLSVTLSTLSLSLCQWRYVRVCVTDLSWQYSISADWWKLVDLMTFLLLMSQVAHLVTASTIAEKRKFLFMPTKIYLILLMISTASTFFVLIFLIKKKKIKNFFLLNFHKIFLMTTKFYNVENKSSVTP